MAHTCGSLHLRYFLREVPLEFGQYQMLSSSIYHKICKFLLHSESYPGLGEGVWTPPPLVTVVAWFCNQHMAGVVSQVLALIFGLSEAFSSPVSHSLAISTLTLLQPGAPVSGGPHWALGGHLSCASFHLGLLHWMLCFESALCFLQQWPPLFIFRSLSVIAHFLSGC